MEEGARDDVERGLPAMGSVLSSERASVPPVPMRQARTTIKELMEVYQTADGGLDFQSDPFGRRDFSAQVLKTFAPRLAVGLAVFVFGSYINNVSQAWLQQNIAGYYEKRWLPDGTLATGPVKLWDVTFHTLPYVKDTVYADIFALGSCAIVIVRYLVLPGPMSLRWVILYRILIVLGLLYLCRAFTIIATPLPNPDHTCKPQISYPDDIWREGWAIFIDGDVTCQDVMFSGHTTLLTTMMLFFLHYMQVSPWSQASLAHDWMSVPTGVWLLSVLYMIMGYYFIVASHFHYTVDVMVGFLMSYFVFNSYHNAIETMWFRKRTLMLHAGLKWLECHAQDMHLWRMRATQQMDEARTPQLELCDRG
eukprot:TRINITY_DN13702_c0_g1_i1.p1 TRINITY_DN13702_c0_g1~~TRINITY_DN13702_c0_g1_i1.p1  ORF type:complete len:406 (-),score=30.34 TRINITY_DN13702_c0_g1_i1:127-1218(-)